MIIIIEVTVRATSFDALLRGLHYFCPKAVVVVTANLILRIGAVNYTEFLFLIERCKASEEQKEEPLCTIFMLA